MYLYTLLFYVFRFVEINLLLVNDGYLSSASVERVCFAGNSSKSFFFWGGGGISE